jgi:hypothetical protein
MLLLKNAILKKSPNVDPDGRIIPFDTYNIFYRNNKIDVNELARKS